MTVIAWDGTTFAADKLCNQQGARFTVTKLFRLNDDEIAAMRGHATRSHAIIEWLRAARDPREYPGGGPDDDIGCVVVVHRTKGVFQYEQGAYPIHVQNAQYANGAGRDYATAAMHLGCDARRAVEVACELNVYCGNGVDVLRFE